MHAELCLREKDYSQLPELIRELVHPFQAFKEEHQCMLCKMCGEYHGKQLCYWQLGTRLVFLIYPPLCSEALNDTFVNFASEARH